MKKQFLIILFLSLGFIGNTPAGEVDDFMKFKASRSCKGCNLIVD